MDTVCFYYAVSLLSGQQLPLSNVWKFEGAAGVISLQLSEAVFSQVCSERFSKGLHPLWAAQVTNHLLK
jgi:hypothetical protein